MRRLGFAAYSITGVSSVGFLLSEPGGHRSAWYLAAACSALLAGFLGLAHRRPVLTSAWALILAGFAGWVAGDLVWTLETVVIQVDSYPLFSDVVYLSSYGVLAIGCLKLVRRRQGEKDVEALLDALIVAGGVGVVAAVFLIVPSAEDSSLTLLGKLVSSAYPLADVVLVAVLLRMWASPGAQTVSFRLLVAAVAATLAGDASWNVHVLISGDFGATLLHEALWLAAYLLASVAVWLPSVHSVVPGVPPTETRGHSSRRRLFLLAGGLALPAFTLLVVHGDPSRSRLLVVSLGSLLLTGLVLLRMSGLVSSVEAQAVQLAALARSDHLTGAANRRTWDHELSRACRHSKDTGEALWLVILDLDRFKVYNDTHGHQTGDRLLREAVAAWSDQLGDDAFLARYGGEEFAILLPGRTLTEVHAAIQRLRQVTPDGQTFSAGVAQYRPAAAPHVTVAHADAALYEAKRLGRNRTVVGDADTPQTSYGRPRIVLQPLVDLVSGCTVAEEALSRFEDRDPEQVFLEAHAEGWGPQLELTAALTALPLRHSHRQLTLNFSLEALAAPGVLDALPEDLSGVVIEVTEGQVVASTVPVAGLAQALRARGAEIAIDDYGAGHSNLDRLLELRPEWVKLDRSVVQKTPSPYHEAIVVALVECADKVGTRLCAEGVETQAQADTLRRLGVRYAQGFLFGHPVAPDPTDPGRPGRLSPKTTAPPLGGRAESPASSR